MTLNFNCVETQSIVLCSSVVVIVRGTNDLSDFSFLSEDLYCATNTMNHNENMLKIYTL